MGQQQFNFSPLRPDGIGAIPQLIETLNKQLAKLASALKGPQTFAVTAPTAREINPATADLTMIALTDDATLTLNMSDSRTASEGTIELAQDATGGRAVTWINALTAPAIATTANARTLLLARRTSDGWVLMTLASGY